MTFDFALGVFAIMATFGALVFVADYIVPAILKEDGDFDGEN